MKILNYENLEPYGNFLMGTHDLPARSPRALDIHIRQITRAHVTTIKYTTFTWLDATP